MTVLQATPVSTLVQIENVKLKFPPIMRIEEIVDEEAAERLGLPEENTTPHGMVVSYRFAGDPEAAAAIATIMKTISSRTLSSLDPIEDSGRWIILRRHGSYAEARAYVKALYDIFDYAETIYDISAAETKDGAYSMVVMIAQTTGPDTAIVYKADQLIDGHLQTLEAAFGPGGTPLDLDQMFPPTIQ